MLMFVGIDSDVQTSEVGVAYGCNFCIRHYRLVLWQLLLEVPVDHESVFRVVQSRSERTCKTYIGHV